MKLVLSAISAIFRNLKTKIEQSENKLSSRIEDVYSETKLAFTTATDAMTDAKNVKDQLDSNIFYLSVSIEINIGNLLPNVGSKYEKTLTNEADFKIRHGETSNYVDWITVYLAITTSTTRPFKIYIFLKDGTGWSVRSIDVLCCNANYGNTYNYKLYSLVPNGEKLYSMSIVCQDGQQAILTLTRIA